MHPASEPGILLIWFSQEQQEANINISPILQLRKQQQKQIK